MSPQIPPAFKVLKSRILSSLSADPSSYTDASPKGSVDTSIRGLIDRINTLEGVVTTSSCAGRVSVFLEGSKRVERPYDLLQEGNPQSDEDVGEDDDSVQQNAVPGGKGRGGRWLYVSHDPVLVLSDKKKDHFTRLFGLDSVDHSLTGMASTSLSARRFVRFQFEPFILHIATASLHHARLILSAALNAGFRESGVQSLKNLYDPAAFPMVAVRTAGLALGSLVGVCNNDLVGDEEEIRALVSEGYLEILVGLANERFLANRERIARLECEIFDRPGHRKDWEDGGTRRERKRREGLARRETLMSRTEGRGGKNDSQNKDQAALMDQGLSL